MIGELVRRILAVDLDHPVRVGIDGPSAAGKTTLAGTLAGALRATTDRVIVRAELDHFMRMVQDRNAYPYDSAESYYLDAWDYPAIRRELLVPLGPGGDRRYRTALTDAAGTTTRDLPVHIAPDDAILLADGVFLQRPELDRHWDLRIYLHLDAAESLRRGVARDRHWMGGAEEAERRYRTRYVPGEERYRAEVRPREHAQIVVEVP
ncbi:uridylate kinase [Jidongwangia harbinensis]|uniref:uridylate kinase n=1 Tax=Jidongwangia harbinensis TaxID=2878561 RepID=UPI001CD9D875|nr:uridylate kinase [Jidongwangia harbinensis]MCA2219404.1 uridylate kinase [Jidongwangia harbinensis]